MITLGFCNLKGGVGKTTACQNIAVALARAGKKIAVVDMDPQSNLSAGFGVTPSPSEPQVFDLLTDEAKWDDIVRSKEGVDIIPSSLNLVMAELNNSGLFENDLLLREALQQQKKLNSYDYILLDSPPQLGIFTRNVLAACDKIIVPMDGGFYSLFGLKLLDSALPVLRERLDSNVEILGILMTNYNPRLSIASSIFNEVKKSFGSLLFETYITQNVSLIEASSMGLSIFEYSPKSKAAECYKEVAEELLKRLEGTAAKVEISKPKTKRTKKQTASKNKKASQSPETAQEFEEKPEIKSVPTPEVETEPEIAPEITPEPISELAPEIKIEEVMPEPEIEIINIPNPRREFEREIELEVARQKEAKEKEQQQAQEKEQENAQNAQVQNHGDSDDEVGSYEKSVKQDLIDLLPERQKNIWAQILAPIHDVSRGEIDVKELREDFSNSDKYRYTFYVLTDDDDKLNPVSFPDQIIEPLHCVVKLDENGSAEIFF